MTSDCVEKSFQQAQIVQKELKSDYLDAGLVDIDENDGCLDMSWFKEQSFSQSGDFDTELRN